jgi:hypothetical protein
MYLTCSFLADLPVRNASDVIELQLRIQFTRWIKTVDKGQIKPSQILPNGDTRARELLWNEPARQSAEQRSRSHHAVIRVYDEAGNVIETHEHKGDFKEW